MLANSRRTPDQSTGHTHVVENRIALTTLCHTCGLARLAAAAAQHARHCPNSPSLYERERWNSLAGFSCTNEHLGTGYSSTKIQG